jgi:hypothetical protein
VLSAVETVMHVFLFVAGIVVPAVHLLIYQPKAIRETLERFDTKKRFTDSCPTPVFGIAVSLVSIGIMQLVSLGFNIVIFFGMVLTGPAASAVLVAEFLACAYLAYSVFRAQPVGWWGSLIFLVYLSARNGVAFLLIDFQEIFRQGGLLDSNSAQIMETALSGIPIGMITASFWAVSGLSAAAYMVYSKKHFR